MAGRIALVIEEWHKITNDPFILDAVQHSYLDFVEDLPLTKGWSPDLHISVYRRKGIIDYDSGIVKLLGKDITVECEPAEHQFVSNIFIREKKGGSFHVILNLSKLNESRDYRL